MLVPVQMGPTEPVIMMDDSLLVKTEGVKDNEDERTTWVEYRLGGEVVHRSAHVTLKKMPAMYGEGGGF